MTQNASVIIAGIGIIAAVAFFVIKSIVGHLLAHYAVKKIRNKWGRQEPPSERK